MEIGKFEQEKDEKNVEEIERFFKEYGIGTNENLEQIPSIDYSYFFYNEKYEETKTIRLSNSTTPMACY